MATYTNQYRVDATFEETIEAVTDALAEEGFGVLADIDMQAAFDAKLDEEFDQYRILGACNPSLAFDALDVEYELGALLPCNVVVYEDGDGTGVSVVDPAEMLALADNENLEPIVEEARAGLTAAMDAVPGATPA
ncbi:DUF302 domain-containing protein [Halorhabdus amylolytica]|uniref:DUF302 domain-containing protein n=1 Tax=Halorhabdus amylolytica TaxID=2559573 RepID=UPI0010AAE75C|nr:DUF302 domain-containing protein [Halorhabdus amylolytica]